MLKPRSKLLDYDALAPPMGQHWGILAVEAGVEISREHNFDDLHVRQGDRAGNVGTNYGLWHYQVVIFLLMTGLYIVIARHNLVKVLQG